MSNNNLHFDLTVNDAEIVTQQLRIAVMGANIGVRYAEAVKLILSKEQFVIVAGLDDKPSTDQELALKLALEHYHFSPSYAEVCSTVLQAKERFEELAATFNKMPKELDEPKSKFIPQRGYKQRIKNRGR